VTATGTFVHKSPDGNTLESGIWIAKELGELSVLRLAPVRSCVGNGNGQSPFGPHSMPMPGGRMGHAHDGLAHAGGGLAVLRIRLLPMAGFAGFATLQVNCALGKVPDEHPTEGVRLSLEEHVVRAGSEWTHHVSRHAAGAQVGGESVSAEAAGS